MKGVEALRGQGCVFRREREAIELFCGAEARPWAQAEHCCARGKSLGSGRRLVGGRLLGWKGEGSSLSVEGRLVRSRGMTSLK